MASKLCCTSGEKSRANSPDLPNARLCSATPVIQPLLPQYVGYPSSRFTSARSEDLIELRDIFNQAQGHVDNRSTPERVPQSRFSRPSLYGLRNLRKMASVRSLLQPKFSREHCMKDLGAALKHVEPKIKANETEQSTLLRKPRKGGPNQHFDITKANLRNHLLSDKRPSEGGYDSDPEILDDMVKDFGKKLTGKRQSVHSIAWTTSVSSKPASEPSTKAGKCLELQTQDHHIFSFSDRPDPSPKTPDLRSNVHDEQSADLGRPCLATSILLPTPSPLSPLRFPSLANFSKNVPQTLSCRQNTDDNRDRNYQEAIPAPISQDSFENRLTTSHSMLNIPQDCSFVSVQRLSVSEGDLCKHKDAITKAQAKTEAAAEEEEGGNDNGEKGSLHSVHLCSMRISHHLRSGSLLSWNFAADGSDLYRTSRLIKESANVQQSSSSCKSKSLVRHEHHTSSSGFASSKVPSKWGRVVSNESNPRTDFASSVYSSRSQSLAENSSGSRMNLSQTSVSDLASTNAPVHHGGAETVSGIEEKAGQQGVIVDDAAGASQAVVFVTETAKDEVVDTKRSKFREELGSSPSTFKSASSNPIMKLLSLKRLSMRSRSETNLRSTCAEMAVDGPSDRLPVPSERERRQSQSMMSLQAEREALNKTNANDFVWARALKAHQEEKASFFLPKNRNRVAEASPFRKRSGSVAVGQSGVGESDAVNDAEGRSSAALPGSVSSALDPFSSRSRRDALSAQEQLDSGQETSNVYEKQGDGPKVVGAWGRYPSHTRSDRTCAISKSDCVDTRDFALEAVIRSGGSKKVNHDNDLIDPMERLPAISKSGRKRKFGSGRLATSSSMTLGKAFLKNYSKMFKSQSTEFRRHGQGHRSSIASGGILDFPELELLPSVWMSSGAGKDMETAFSSVSSDAQYDGAGKEKGTGTVRPRRTSSVPHLSDVCFSDGGNQAKEGDCGARAWSVYYERCVRSCSQPDWETDIGFEDVLHGRRVASRSRSSRHSRNVSQVSRFSQASESSVMPRRACGSEEEGGEEKSVASVRRSTIDLISRFREQERVEHDKILALTTSGP